MAHKTLTISEEAYEALVGLKKEGESFTALIKRITQPLRKKKLSDFVGVLSGEEFDDFEKAALEVRHSPSTRLKRLEL
ncbi:MAG: antitoxin VapB family protein [Candidatus Methanoperedens sp.]|jgi:predicted CopG family antitoxin|nr:antitoxin VapB family protein [Candidatus Methanoperedens sp.]PKL53209.1 MAG: antitoxin [Candidatus Methanoperedenaceae archaeon HGW-Methanoperedenaceae-1]